LFARTLATRRSEKLQERYFIRGMEASRERSFLLRGFLKASESNYFLHS